MFLGSIRKLRRRKHTVTLQKITQLSNHDLLKFLRQNRRNRDRPVVSNLRGSRFLWNWDNIGQSLTCRKTTNSNQVSKNYSQFMCQLPSYLPVIQWKHTNGIIFIIRIMIQKQTANKARPKGNRTQCRRRVTSMRLLKTISALFSIKVRQNQGGLLIGCADQLPPLSSEGVKLELAPKIVLFAVDHHFRGFGAFVKSDLLRSVNARSASS